MLDSRTLRRTLRRLAFGVAAVVVLHPSSATAQIRIAPGTDIQALVNANPPGTAFVLGAGVHRMQTIRPKDGNVFTGESGAILSGAKQLTDFTRSGSGPGPSAEYLSDGNRTFATNGWGPIERDQSNGETDAFDGHTLTLNGQTYAKGLGVHAPSDVRFQLGGSCTSLAASLGVDDEAGANGRVTFEVWADGIKLYDSGALTNGSAIQNINLDISGRSDLQLIVTDAGDPSYDHADWADARVSCGGGGGGYWVASGQSQQSPFFGACQQGDLLCLYPEQLFIDNRQLRLVGSLGEVGAGTYYFDYDADRIYFADDPTGRLVETSVTAAGFDPTGNNVTISGLIIEKYANLAQKGVIDGQGRTDWVVTNNEVRYNHGGGIRAGARAQVLRNNVHHNGQMGISATGDRVLVQDNEIAYNNSAGYEIFWEGGGTKFVSTTNLVVRGNFAHHNFGPGLWSDKDNLNVLYENNTSEDNWWNGIVHEISYSAIIRNNIVRRNGFGYPDWIAGAGILVAASPNVEIYGNLVENNADGIGGMQQTRGSGAYGPWELSNFWVHDNTVVMSTGWTGILQDNGDSSVFTARNNRFEGNHYQLGPNRLYFAWMNAERSEAEWRSLSQDVNGMFVR